MKKRSETFYSCLWREVILPKMKMIENESSYIYIEDEDSARRRIKERYDSINLHCSHTYMKDPGKPLDRHKVAACYMLAIEEAYPLRIERGRESDDSVRYPNERLAIVVGCSVLASYLMHSIEDEETCLTDDQREEAKRILSEGMPLSNLHVGHGSYDESFFRTLPKLNFKAQRSLR